MLFIFFRSVLIDFSSYLLLRILINPTPAKVLGLFPFYSFLTKFPALLYLISLITVKADSHIACRAHAIPLPCRAAKGLECVFPI